MEALRREVSQRVPAHMYNPARSYNDRYKRGNGTATEVMCHKDRATAWMTFSMPSNISVLNSLACLELEPPLLPHLTAVVTRGTKRNSVTTSPNEILSVIKRNAN